MRLSVVLDCLDPDELTAFWAAALGFRPIDSPAGYRVLVAPGGSRAGVFVLQRVAEPRAGKNRMHVDLHPSLEVGVPALVERLEALGGRRLGPVVTELLADHGIWWQVMADPEGNEFCVVADAGHPPPE